MSSEKSLMRENEKQKGLAFCSTYQMPFSSVFAMNRDFLPVKV